MAKVLHVITSMQAGGAERVVAEYAKWHDRSRYEPEVCCVLTSGPFADSVAASGVPVHVLGRRGRFDLMAIARLARIIGRGRFDVVHNHNFTALAAGLPASILGRARAVVRTEHNVVRTRGRARHYVSRAAALSEDAQIAVSAAVRRAHTECGRIPRARFVTIMNGIDEERLAPGADRAAVRRELGLADDAVVCLNIGSLTEQKNRRALLDATARLSDIEALRMLVVGSGPEREKLEARAGELGLSRRVLFLGQRLDVPDLLAASDIFVLSSDWEGLPITILEAMTSGIPCVATAVGGVPEALTDGVTGVTVEPGRPGALADGIRTLARDPELRARMAGAAREEFEQRFRAEQMVRQTEALYDMALAGRAALAPAGRIKVLYVIGQLGRGGAERQMAELVRRLPLDLFEPVVCCLQGPDVLGDEMEDAGVRVIYMRKRGGVLSGTTLRLANLIRRERPAVLHSYLFSANWRSLLAGRLMRVPLTISSVRNVDIHAKSATVAIERVLAVLTDRVIANAEAVKDHVSHRHLIPAEKIRIVYNGVSLARANGQREGKSAPGSVGDPGVAGAHEIGEAQASDRASVSARVSARGGCVAMIASLTPKKDHGTFLEAARMVSAELPGTRFLLVGDGELRNELAGRVRSMGLSDAVELPGATDDIASLLSRTDVSVLTSLKEGCSNVILESMAAGCPLVVTDVGGNRELIEAGTSGYLVPPGDAAGIARRVLELLKDPDLRHRMGQAGRARVRARFTVGRMVDETVAFYLSLLKVKAPGLEKWARLVAAREAHAATDVGGASSAGGSPPLHETTSQTRADR
jgi:glycosyltransferase involved in cell wall biosynthesis